MDSWVLDSTDEIAPRNRWCHFVGSYGGCSASARAGFGVAPVGTPLLLQEEWRFGRYFVQRQDVSLIDFLTQKDPDKLNHGEQTTARLGAR